MMLNSLGYEYNQHWLDPGASCGFEAAPTYEELMISVLEREPYWMDYQRFNENTINTKKLYKWTNSNLPSGNIMDPLKYDGRRIETPLREQILNSNFQSFYFLQYIAYDKEFYGRKFVDVWLLAEGLTETQMYNI